MADWKVPLADVRVREEEIAAVAETYRSGWLSMGPETERFERAFAKYVGIPHAVAVANGTAALHLLLAAAGIGPGDEVVVPSMTFVATANAVRYTGATVAFADIAGPTRPWITPETVEPLITERTKAILALPYGGHPGEAEALAGLARERGLSMLIDAAHSVETRLHGRHIATLCDGAAFSFFSNKNLAIGEGGMVVTADEAIAGRVRQLRSHGMTTLTWDRHRGHASTYDVVALGFNYRMDEPRATLARARLERLDEDNERRARIVDRYRRSLGDMEGISLIPPPSDDVREAHHLFTVVLDDGADRDGFRSSLRERGIQTSVHYPPAHRFSIYQQEAVALPHTEAYGDRTVTLPLFAHLQPDDQDAVIDAVRSALGSAARARAAS